MFHKNVFEKERVFRAILGLGIIFWGYSLSGNYWLSYTAPIYQIPCWEFNSFLSNGCLVERGFTIATIGLIPILTGMFGWCPLKAIVGMK